jgi:toxin ParE1/3/4
MVRLPIDIHSEAHLEEEAAFHWYLKRSLSSAETFLQAIEQARSAIQESPESWAKYLHGTRRYLLHRFPYVVVYRVTKDRIEIIAIAHGRRKSAYWVGRLEPAG